VIMVPALGVTGHEAVLAVKLVEDPRAPCLAGQPVGEAGCQAVGDTRAPQELADLRRLPVKYLVLM
jgi:hypothetical protein